MLITKREEVTKQGFCNILWRRLRPRGSLLLEFIHWSGWGGVSAYLSLIGGSRGWALIRGRALINFFCLQDGRLFEVGANSTLGAYSNKYSTLAKQASPAQIRSPQDWMIFFFWSGLFRTGDTLYSVVAVSTGHDILQVQVTACATDKLTKTESTCRCYSVSYTTTWEISAIWLA